MRCRWLKPIYTERTQFISLRLDLLVCIYLNYLLLSMPFKEPELEHGFCFCDARSAI